MLAVRSVDFEDPSGHKVAGTELHFAARTRWRSADSAHDRAAVIATGALDLVLRWPSDATQVRVEIDGVRRRSSSIPIEVLAPYELGEILTGGAALPASILKIHPDALVRIDMLSGAAFRLPVPVYDRVLGALAQVSAAASAKRPVDRVVPLWSALTELVPQPRRDLPRIEAILRRPGFVADERRRSDAWRNLLVHRREVARDPWFHAPVQALVASRPRKQVDQMRAATVLAYAARSAVAHGHWARALDRVRPMFMEAEKWLWCLVEREFESAVIGKRLPPWRPGAP